MHTVKDLSEHIEYLLLEESSVVLPGLGTFHVENVPARYIEEENMFLPPSRTVSFTEDRDAADDSLRICLENLHGIPVQTASSIVDEYIKSIDESLLTSGEYDFGTIGQFVQSSDSITFYPCEAGITSQEFFALDTFELRTLPTLSVKSRDVKEHSDNDYYVIRVSKRLVRNTARIAAMLIVAFLIVFPGRQMNERYELTHQFKAGVESLYNSLVETKQDCPAAEAVEKPLPKKILPVAKPHKDTAMDSVQATEQETPQQTQEAELQAVEEVQQVPQEDYCVVLASSTPVKMAEAYVRELEKKGISGAYVSQNGKMTRVLLSGFATSEEAVVKARELRNLYDIDAWTMRTPK